MRIGIDLGGTKIEIVALGNRGDVLMRERAATPQGDYLATVMAVAGLVATAEQKVGAGATVGIGIPGAESRSSGLINPRRQTTRPAPPAAGARPG